MLSTFGIRPPRWLTTLGRAFVTLEGTLRQVDPSFSLIDSALEVVSERSAIPHPDSFRSSMEMEAAKQIPRLRRIPQRVDELLGQASHGRLTARISLFADDDNLRGDHHASSTGRCSPCSRPPLGIGSVLLLGTKFGPAVNGSVSVERGARLHRPGRGQHPHAADRGGHHPRRGRLTLFGRVAHVGWR